MTWCFCLSYMHVSFISVFSMHKSIFTYSAYKASCHKYIPGYVHVRPTRGPEVAFN